MEFSVPQAVEILGQTPYTLERLLGSLSDGWTRSSKDESKWGVYDVVGHLIHGEETDWIPRARIILEQGEDRRFVPFDRLAQFHNAGRRSLTDLLTEFAHARNANVETLVRWQLSDEQLKLWGTHPELGEVTLEQLLATWVVHDLNHIRQIVGVLAERYSENVGPWHAYLSILH